MDTFEDDHAPGDQASSGSSRPAGTQVNVELVEDDSGDLTLSQRSADTLELVEFLGDDGEVLARHSYERSTTDVGSGNKPILT